MKFEALPDLPGGWIQYINGEHPELKAPGFVSLLKSLEGYGTGPDPESAGFIDGALESMLHSGALHGSAKQLERRGAVAVVASVYPDLFGGRLSQLLKCLTAARISEELARRSIDSIAVCWIRSYRDREYSLGRTLNLLDAERSLHKFSEHTGESADKIPEGAHLYAGTADLIAQVEKLGSGNFDGETLALLKGIHASGHSGLARMLATIMRPWHGIVIDAPSQGFRDAMEKSPHPSFPAPKTSLFPGSSEPAAAYSADAARDYCLQCFLFPRPIFVLDAWDCMSFVQVKSFVEGYCGHTPLCWPAASATIIDKDSRRTLRKYGLDLEGVLAAGPGLLERLEEKISSDPAGQRLGGLASQLQESLRSLEDPAMGDRSFRKAREDCQRRILFQLRKTANRFERARLQKLETLQRRMTRLCASLMPDGRVQERGLSAVHFLLFYGMTFPAVLYENLGLETFEHQTVDLY